MSFSESRRAARTRSTREPIGTITSLVVGLPHVSISAALREYIRYYRLIARFRRFVALSSFEDTTRRLASTIEMVNEQFGLNLCRFSMEKGDVQRVFDRIDQAYQSAYLDRGNSRLVPRPEPARRAAQCSVMSRLLSGDYDRKLGLAFEAYGALMAEEDQRPVVSWPGRR